MKTTKETFAKRKADTIFSAKPNGREKEYKESIYWGVGNKPYADMSDCKKAGIKIKAARKSPSGAWYYLSKSDAVILISWLNK